MWTQGFGFAWARSSPPLLSLESLCWEQIYTSDSHLLLARSSIQWMEHSVVLARRKSHLNPWWSCSGNPGWIQRSPALVTSIGQPLCGHQNAQQHKRHKIWFPLSFSTVVHCWVSPQFIFDIGKNINVKGVNYRRVQFWLGGVSTQARNFHLCLPASPILSWSGLQRVSEWSVKDTVQIKQRGRVNIQKLLCLSSLICSWYLGCCCDNSVCFFEKEFLKPQTNI